MAEHKEKVSTKLGQDSHDKEIAEEKDVYSKEQTALQGELHRPGTFDKKGTNIVTHLRDDQNNKRSVKADSKIERTDTSNATEIRSFQGQITINEMNMKEIIKNFKTKTMVASVSYATSDIDHEHRIAKRNASLIPVNRRPTTTINTNTDELITTTLASQTPQPSTFNDATRWRSLECTDEKTCPREDVQTQLNGDLKKNSYVIAILIVMKFFTIIAQIT